MDSGSVKIVTENGCDSPQRIAVSGGPSKPEAYDYAHHRFFPFQAIRITFSHPGVEHLRLATRGEVLVLRPSGVYVSNQRTSELPQRDPMPLDDAYQTESEETDPNQTDPDWGRCGRGGGSRGRRSC